MDHSSNLVIVANRLPVQLVRADGGSEWRTSPGGLVSALTAALRDRVGDWIGWAGEPGSMHSPHSHQGFRLHGVSLSVEDYEAFYLGFSNATIWPLYHDAIKPARFERRWWHSYVEVNRRYAEVTAAVARTGATVWIHDYQLQLVPQILRQCRPDLTIGFFLHVPFPPQELFLQLPWRRQILEGIAGADVVGFQVPGAAANFARLARRVIDATGTDSLVVHAGRHVRVGAFPVSIDVDHLRRMACDPDVQTRAKQIRADLGNPRRILLGVDRLDYTKGIDLRIRALEELYADDSLDPSSTILIQVASPSRDADRHYQNERHHLEQLVGQVNGDWGQVGRPVVHYLHQHLDSPELVALYLAADVMLVTPLRDGMNLVAKEYVASREDGTGVLVLSEFTGAAAELRGAITVNPHDLEGVKQAIRDSVAMSHNDMVQRMRRLRRTVQRNDVHRWASRFTQVLDSSRTAPQATGRF